MLCCLSLQAGVSILSGEEQKNPEAAEITEWSGKTESGQSEYDEGSRAMLATARHLEGSGVGYSRGYTSLDVFLSPKRCNRSWVPFLDLRGHVFNNGRYAANAGLGVRYVGSSIAWGVNSYYDYRNTNRFHYNQVGAGLEAIGSFWSVSVNGYLPVGKKQSPFSDPILSGTAAGPSFGFFEGNNFFITLSGSQGLSAKRQFAFKGIDAIAAFRLLKKNYFSLDFGIGPYYFHGKYRKFAAGGKASLTARFSEYGMASVSTTYDNLFHQRVQGEVGISIPFGPRSFSKSCATAPPCEIPSFFDSQLARGADRSEIIVVDDHRKILADAAIGNTEVAINPLTGQPYLIYFVNNLSSSAGTFESPFPTIQEALAVAHAGDIIYVYQGDGSPYDGEYTLLDDQMLLGSGVAQLVQTAQGLIAIPAQTSGAPSLEDTSMGLTFVTLANRNTVSGFDLIVLSSGEPVSGTGIAGAAFLNNSFSTAIDGGIDCFCLTDCSGTLLVQNNRFTLNPADTSSSGVCLSDSGSVNSTLSILNNIFTNQGQAGISAHYIGSSTPTLNISGNTFTPPSAALTAEGIDLLTTNDAGMAGSISNQNQFNDYVGNAINVQWVGASPHSLAIANNSISSDPSAITNGISLLNSASAMTAMTISGNQFNDQTTGINGTIDPSANFSLSIESNVFTAPPGANTLGISLASSNGSAVPAMSYSIKNNILNGHTATAIESTSSMFANVDLEISNNVLTAAANGNGPGIVGIQILAGNNSSFPNINLSGNAWTGPATYQAGTSPNGIALMLNDQATVSNLAISANDLTLPLTAYQSNTQPTGINVTMMNNSVISDANISQNRISYSNSNFQSNTSLEGIDLRLIDSAVLTAGAISGNTVFFASLPAPLSMFSPVGITLSISDASTAGANAAPILIASNQIENVEGNGIFVSSASSQDAFAAVLDNRVSFGSMSQSAFGIMSTTFDAKFSLSIDSNTIVGNQGGVYGILAVSSSSGCQDIDITNNTITDVQFPVSPAGAGIGIFPEGSGIFNVLIQNNGLSGNTSQGLLAVDSQSLGGTADLCITVQGNHGAGTRSPDGYSLYNSSMAPPSTFIYNDAGNNTGTFNFVPSMSDFMPGTCSSCP